MADISQLVEYYATARNWRDTCRKLAVDAKVALDSAEISRNRCEAATTTAVKLNQLGALAAKLEIDTYATAEAKFRLAKKVWATAIAREAEQETELAVRWEILVQAKMNELSP